MKTPFELVTDFHNIMDQPIRHEPTLAVPEVDLRWRLIFSEVKELFTALVQNDTVEIADALGDIVYVVEGAAITFGFGPTFTLIYEDETKGGETLMVLNQAIFILREGLSNEDIDAVRTSLSMIKSACYTLAAIYGWDLDAIIDVIHKSNLTKLDDDGKPVYITEGPDKGKVTKSENYVPPTSDILELIS